MRKRLKNFGSFKKSILLFLKEKKQIHLLCVSVGKLSIFLTLVVILTKFQQFVDSEEERMEKNEENNNIRMRNIIFSEHYIILHESIYNKKAYMCVYLCVLL